MKTLKDYINTYGEDYGKRIEEATNQIKEGGRFNGTVYAKRVSTQNRDVSVYVDGNYHGLGRFHYSEVEEIEELFFSLLKEDEEEKEVEETVKETTTSNTTTNELVDTGLGYFVRRDELARANMLGFDGIESDNYY